MAGKPRTMYKKKPQKGKMNKFGKKSKRFADVKSFKLAAKTTAIYTYAAGGGPGTATVAGPGLAMSIPSVPGNTNRTSFVCSYTASLNNVYNLPLVQAFDRYKIVGVKLRFIPQWNVIDIQGQPIAPEMKVIYDFDDANVSGETVPRIWSRQGKIYRLDKPVTVYYKPRVPLNVYKTSGTTIGYTSSKAPYINQVYSDVPHYGIKFAVRDWYVTSTTQQNVQMRIECTYYVTLREQLNANAVDLDDIYDSSGNVVANFDDDLGDINENAPGNEKPPE